MHLSARLARVEKQVLGHVLHVCLLYGFQCKATADLAKEVTSTEPETLRKWPIAGLLGRVCTESYVIPDTSIIVEKGTKVFIPINALQRDLKFFPDPERFDPERFSKENVTKIVPGSYLPFGDGPRFCIGMRLALTDVKVMLILVISKYVLSLSSRSPKPITFDRKSFTLSPQGKIFLHFKNRK